MRPKSSSDTFICRKSMARTVPSVIGTSYVSPVRLSVTVRVSSLMARSLVLAAFLPAATEHAPEPSRAQVRLVLGGAGQVAVRELCRLLGVQRELHAPLGDAGDLGRVDPALAAGRVDHQAVEDVLALVLQDLAHRADLRP